MRTASTIVSWLGAIVTTIWSFVSASQGFDLPAIATQYVGGHAYSYETTMHVATPGWLYALLVIMIFVRLGILIWRSSSLSNGKKVGCGVFTLIFCSLIGGILTLCIPEDDLL